MHRSYLFAPGHNAKLLRRVFEAGADAVMLDLEDAVPPDAKQQARAMVAGALADRSAWVRINTVRTDLAAADLDAVAGLALPTRRWPTPGPLPPMSVPLFSIAYSHQMQLAAEVAAERKSR